MSEKELREMDPFYAYNHMGMIRVGDRFVWRQKKKGYLTSGGLPDEYTFIPRGKDWERAHDESVVILTVCHIEYGDNVDGFPDFWCWLTADSMMFKRESDFTEDDCVVVNALNAFSMERTLRIGNDALIRQCMEHERKKVDDILALRKPLDDAIEDFCLMTEFQGLC